MDPRLRTLLFVLAASALAAWVGVTLANEEHFLATLCAAVAVWAVLAWTRGPLAEAWLLGFLFFGYIIGNRGFAQISPVPGLPVFFSELGLAAALVLVVLRGTLRRTLPVRRDWLNGLLLLWLALGCGRILADVRAYGFVALRDFAMVYYLLYFFVTQGLAAHLPSRGVLRAALVVTFTALPLTGLLGTLFPDFFLTNLLISGVPVIFYKGDLLATFLFTGFVLLVPDEDRRWNENGWRWLAALVSLVLGLSLLSRSSLLGLLVAIGWLAWSGRWRPARVLAAVCVAGLLSVTVYSLLQKKDFTQTKVYAVYEAVVSITDYSGTGNYRSEMSGDKGDNNRFRLVWWKNVAQETLANSPVLGLGFGADLAKGFLLEYYPTADVDFTARSPHNIFMTTLGRMGLAGASVLLCIYWVQARNTARVARAARTDPTRRDAMTLQAAVWVLMVSACLGVVLEGPMGAIPFWIMLGLAHHAANATEA
jgi:O-antigen ligase